MILMYSTTLPFRLFFTDGYSYERTAITAWMEKGKGRSPMTNAVLVTKEMTPNRSLKMIIQRYLNLI